MRYSEESEFMFRLAMLTGFCYVNRPQLDLTFNVAAKWLLTWASPRLALRTIRSAQMKKKDRSTV